MEVAGVGFLVTFLTFRLKHICSVWQGLLVTNWSFKSYAAPY